MAEDLRINKRYCSDRLRTDYAHVGLLDVVAQQIWIARKRFGTPPIRVSHARMIRGGSQHASTADKDRFLCYWFHTPGTGEGPVHGYPIEWDEGHLMVRLDPTWDYRQQELLRSTDAAKIEKNIDTQFKWGERIFRSYVEAGLKFPLSWHMIGPRPADSMFYVERCEGI